MSRKQSHMQSKILFWTFIVYQKHSCMQLTRVNLLSLGICQTNITFNFQRYLVALHLYIAIVWLNLGSRGATEVAPLRSCWKVPPCLSINTILLIPSACLQNSSLQRGFKLFSQFMIRSTSCLSTHSAMARNFYCLES